MNISQAQPISDSRFGSTFSMAPQTDPSKIKISRSCWMGFHKNRFHPSLTQYRLSYEEFNNTLNKVESECSGFSYIKCWYTMVVLNLLFCLILIGVGGLILPGEEIGTRSAYEVNHNVGLAFILTGILLGIFGTALNLGWVFYLLKGYEIKIKQVLQIENNIGYHFRNIRWSVGPMCKWVEVECLPITVEEYYNMMKIINQGNLTKEFIEGGMK